MIKINLIKSKVGIQAPADVSIDFGSGGSGEGGSNAGALIKILLMVGFIAAAMLYRDSQLTQIRTQLETSNGEVFAVQAQIDQKKQEAGAKPELEAEARALNNKLEILRNLSRLRLTEVKSLDFIQSIIPERVWLQSIDYKPPQFRISGFSTAEEEVTKFLSGLEAGPYFTDVILLQSKEQKTNQGTIKTFEISFRAESAN